MKVEHIRADVVVVGGAITGLWAAIRAKEVAPDKDILLVDKGTAGNSGCANWAGGAITFLKPEDDLEALIQHYLSLGGGIADEDWLRMSLVETHDRVLQMHSWGVPFQIKDGEFYRRKGRGGGSFTALSRGKTMLKAMRKRAKKLGVRIVDKVMIVDLIDTGDRFAGVAGFKIGEDRIKPYVFSAGAIVLVPGPCSFKASYIGHRMVTGDGIAAAFRHGAEVMGIEFAVSHNTGPRLFDNSGMGRYGEMGAKLRNRLGEEFMPKYDPVLANRATWNTLLYGMAKEVEEGRGPLYLDFSAISEEDFQLLQVLNPHTFMALERMGGLDLRRDRIEWIPSFAGNRASGAGLRIRKDLGTTLPGVFTGGDTGGKYHYGANSGYSGMNFGWCAISGYHAGESAAKWSDREGSKDLKPPKQAVDDALQYMLAPSQNNGSLTPDDVIGAVQDAIIPYKVCILKEEHRLKEALQKITAIRERLKELTAKDSHALMKAHEAQNMVLIAELILRASLLRTETRGVHHRVDYPETDDRNWKLWMYCKRSAKTGIEFWTEDAAGAVHTIRAGD